MNRRLPIYINPDTPSHNRRSTKRCVCLGVLLFAAHAAVSHAQLSLHDAIALGLAQAPDARTSSDRVDVQRAQLAQAKLRPNPRLYIQSEDLRPWDHTFSFPDSTEDYGYLSETFELAGKRGKRITYAESGVRRSEATHTYELQQLAGGIAYAYWNVATTRAAVAAWKQQLADFDRLVRYQSDRVQAGATAGVDLLRTQVERDRVALSSAQAERDAEAAAIELARRTASLTARTAALTDPLERERPIADLALTAVIEQRPDIIAAHEALTEARNDLRLQHANGSPNLDFLGGYKRNVGVNTLYGGLQYDLPFFNRNQGGIATAAANLQLADDQLAYARLAATSEIEAAASDYHREQALVQSTLPGMGDRAQQNVTIIAEAYRSGGTDLLRYLDAERILLDTRLLAIETWAAYQRAAIALQLAYGEQP